ncbi:hypothetical protein ABH922_001544 [Rhodococcus sp. 27YEA15]
MGSIADLLTQSQALSSLKHLLGVLFDTAGSIFRS